MLSILIGAVVTIVVLISIVMSLRSRVSFEERYPPISDTEFLARCRPGTNPDVALKVRRIMARHLGVDYKRVHPTLSFIEDFGAD